MCPVDHIQPVQNYVSVAHSRTVFVTNIFLKLGYLSNSLDHVFPQKRVKFTLIIQSFSLQDQKLKSRKYPILYAL